MQKAPFRESLRHVTLVDLPYRNDLDPPKEMPSAFTSLRFVQNDDDGAELSKKAIEYHIDMSTRAGRRILAIEVW